LILSLHYTWILAAVLELWWLALLWLPEHFPKRGGLFYWSVAVAVILLFVVCVVLHELVHSAMGRTGTRYVNLYPFGAAMPFGTATPEPGRAIAASLAGPAFNLILGFALIVTSNGLPGPEGPAGALQALLLPLGWLNVALGAFNLIPGIPFDGGWAVASLVALFSDDFDTGSKLARNIGGLAALALVLVGAWRGLTSDAWLQALTLVLIGWAARDASNLGQQRGLIRGAFEQLTARKFMVPTKPGDPVNASGTVADMVRAHSHHPPNLPLPVQDEGGNLVGITTLESAEELLQGTWASTPVTALMTQLPEVQAVGPDSPLTEVLALARAREGTPNEDIPIPVISGGKLLGSVDANRLDAFEQVGQIFGIEEATNAATQPRGFLGRLGAALPVLMVVAAMAILGNIALRTDPEEIRDAMSGVGTGDFTFSNFRPVQDSIVSLGPTDISLDVAADSPVVSATVTLDGDPIEAQVNGGDTLTKTVTAQLGGTTLGNHTVRVVAYAESGTSDSASWNFLVGSRGASESPTPAQGEAGPLVEVVTYRPPFGGRVLAGSEGLPLVVRVKAAQEPASVRLLLDGKALEAEFAPVEEAGGFYAIRAVAPALRPGGHRAQVVVQGAERGYHSAEWSFTALTPDENNLYFKETGYFIRQPFLTYWQENGGLQMFGYPISYRLEEIAPGTEEVYTAQYFERARFELHPSTGNNVVLGRLGALLNEPEPPAAPLEGMTFFPETGHNLGGPFLTYWQENGGLALFGYPISEERMEKNPVDGKTYVVQYFERNRFELHPELAGTPHEVQLGLLGRQIYARNYGQ
jgi:Zn-dependent protease